VRLIASDEILARRSKNDQKQKSAPVKASFDFCHGKSNSRFLLALSLPPQSSAAS
jgi:hypothetical protein